jgi:radical SAM superfamily enzyme YgiQ (UPF0313 family)
VKLLLVDNLILPEEGSLALLDVHPHLGLLALAAAAEAHGDTVEIYDAKRLIRDGSLPYDVTLYDRVAAALLVRRPQAVGFTTLGCSFLFAVNVAAILKRHEPDLPILLGGPHATMLHRQILERFPQFDVVVRHECDEIFPDVLDALDQRRFDLIAGLSWRVNSSPRGLRFTQGKPKVDDLDTLPIASYEHYPVAELGLDLLRIEAGRGCPFACTFCSTAGFFQRSFRLKSAGRLVQELDILHARYGFRDFKLDHDMFTVNRRKVLEFCEAVSGRGYRWRASARVDCVDSELLEKMAEAGCVGLYFGIETGSVRMQRVCRKGLDLTLVLPTLVLAEHLGIETTASFITGYPEESQQDQDDTLDMLGRCFRPACLPQLHLLTPEPGTPMFEEHGSRLAHDGHGGPYNAERLDPQDEALVLQHPEIFQTYYYYPADMPRRHHIFAVEAVALLRRVGPFVLRYLLRAYDGRLSELARHMRSFADRRFPDRPPEAAMLEAFVSETYGADHHLTSLVRFALQVNEGGGERNMPADTPPPVLDPAASYRLSPTVRLLADIHDCEALLARIAEDSAGTELLAESEAGGRGICLFARNGRTVTPHRIDPGVAAVLSLFEQPRRVSDVARAVCDATGIAELPSEFFADLVRARIIEPCVPRSGAVEPTRETAALAVTDA